MNEWIIQSRSHACQACERHFADKEHYHTLLQTNKHELIRLDICKSCWEAKQAKSEAEPKGFISQWTGVYHATAAVVHTEAIQKESAETLLRKLIEANDPKYGPACYILAVMLERKRLLKVKEQFKREGTRVFIYEHPKSGDIFTITDPDLQLNQLAEVQRDVSELLANGFGTPTPAVAPTPQAPMPDEPAAAEQAASETPEEETEAPSAETAAPDTSTTPAPTPDEVDPTQPNP